MIIKDLSISFLVKQNKKKDRKKHIMTITKIAVVDIETTHLESDYGTIVEVGICELNLEDGSIIKLLDTVVREPDFNAERDATAWVFINSNLTVQDILNAPEWIFIRPKITEIFKKYPVTAFNKQFDLTWLKDRGVEVFLEFPDPMVESTCIIQLPSSNPNHGMYKYPSVIECWNWYFPITPLEHKHRAYEDCVHEAQIVYKMFTLGHINFT